MANGTQWKRMGLCALLGVAAGFAASFLSPRLYEARAEIWIQGDEASRQAQNLGDDLATQLAILRSEGVFHAALLEVSKQRKKKELLEDEKAMFRFYKVDVPQGSAVAMVRVRAFAPEVAADMANEVARTYRLKRAAAVSAQELARQESFYEKLRKARNNVEVAEKALQSYKMSTGAPDLDSKIQQTISYEAGLTARLDTARSELGQAQSEIKTTEGQLSSIPRTSRTRTVRIQNAEVTALQDKLNNLQRERIELLRTYTETSTRVTAIDDAIVKTRQQLNAANNKPWQESEQEETLDPRWRELNMNLAASRSRRAALASEIKTLEGFLGRVRAEMARLPAAQQGMQRLQREYDLAMSRFKVLEQQAAAMETDAISEKRYAQTLMSAKPDKIPVSPNVPLLLTLGLMLGLVGGGIYNYAIERGRKPVRTPGELERFTGLPAAGATSLPRRTQEKLLRELPMPGSRPAESFRFLALTNPPGEGGKAILFTSVGPNVGCSSAAGQFALALAAEGRHTMLVDCDFRKASLTHVFNSQSEPGLSDILRRTLLPSSESEVSFGTAHANLMFLPSGSIGEGASIADFSHTQLRAAIELLKDKADILVLDSPPCDLVTDAVRLAPLVDEVYLVVGAEDGEAPKVTMAHRLLERCGAKNVQVLLSGTDRDAAPFSAA